MIGYLDLPSGLSGDIMLGCLVDAGWPVEDLRAAITRLKLPSDEWSVEARTVMKGPLRATLVDVNVVEGHAHRHLRHIREIIEAADLPDTVKAGAIAVFVRLANAEAKVHGTTPEKIHFHEVGALDAIVDIVGSAAGLEALGIEQVYASAAPMGLGWANTQHGQIPLPAPATLELLSAVNAPTRPAPGEGEWVTPTGAAILAEYAEFSQPAMHIERIGIGAGQKDCDWPNVARLWVGELQAAGPIVQIETNIDDMNPQLYAAVSEKLFATGARDVWVTPIQMKKNRPAVTLSVLAPAANEAALTDVLLRETTTLGLRVQRLSHRGEARREMRTVDTEYGPVEVKLKWVDHDLVGATPEYDSCVKAAYVSDAPVRRVYEAALAAAQGWYGDGDGEGT